MVLLATTWCCLVKLVFAPLWRRGLMAWSEWCSHNSLQIETWGWGKIMLSIWWSLIWIWWGGDSNEFPHSLLRCGTRVPIKNFIHVQNIKAAENVCRANQETPVAKWDLAVECGCRQWNSEQLKQRKPRTNCIQDNSYARHVVPGKTRTQVICTQDSSYPGQLVHKRTRTQDNFSVSQTKMKYK